MQLDKTTEQLWVGNGEYHKISAFVNFWLWISQAQSQYLTAQSTND